MALAVMAALGTGGAAAQEGVDLELVLLADASGSIDDREIALQRQGYAEAMADPQVLWAIEHGGAEGRIAVAYVEWASAASQDVVVDWMVIGDAADAAEFGRRITAPPRRAFGSNAIGSALLKGLEMIEENGIDAWRKVIDLSADSSWNPQGPPISAAREAVVAAGVTINGLAILCRAADCSGRPRAGDLEAEFERDMIGGPGAFVVTAEDPLSFMQAVRRKLILEIAGPSRDPSVGFDVVWKTPGQIAGDEWTDHVPESADLVGDRRAQMDCGNASSATGECGSATN
jgi:hypothetical protein